MLYVPKPGLRLATPSKFLLGLSSLPLPFVSWPLSDGPPERVITCSAPLFSSTPRVQGPSQKLSTTLNQPSKPLDAVNHPVPGQLSASSSASQTLDLPPPLTTPSLFCLGSLERAHHPLSREQSHSVLDLTSYFLPSLPSPALPQPRNYHSPYPSRQESGVT